MIRIACMLCLLAALFTLAGTIAAAPPLSLSPAALHLSADPPAEPVKLIFIHHSTGGNWLADPNDGQPYGGLGRALMENYYFVSATNYGWGPDGIGDRTDIPNWLEWFVGPNRDAIMHAVYTENEQNVGDFGQWSRMRSDPAGEYSGGENVIIMFKSCFPNSNLEGKPDDPALTEANDWEYSVANAKAVYNALLTYFETRQDKLFVVITAPPLMRSETTAGNAANARAFNTWLVHEWLAGYPYANVAVFDYYHVLTDPANHHRWNGDAVEHVQGKASNVSAYPSGDSHPSTEGHSKATAEFVPLLNVAYNRWQAEGAVQPPSPPTAQPAEPTPDEPTEAPPKTVVPSATTGSGIDDFEGDLEWYVDLGEGTALTCDVDGNAHSGAAALLVNFTIPTDSWGGCGRYYDDAQNWSDGDGLTLWARADTPDLWVTLIVYSGRANAPTPFESGFEVKTDWNAITISWDDFARASWADENGLVELDPARITSIAFSFGAGQGKLWVDDIARSAGELPPPEPPTPEHTTEAPTAEEQPPAEPTEAPSGRGGLCASAPLALVLLAVGFVRERPLRKSK